MNQRSNLEDDVESVAAENGGAITETESRHIRERPPLRAAVVYEIIRHEGESELTRSMHALWWSGLAAGLSIGFSFLSEAWLASVLPDEPWKPLIDNLGYTVGFLIVILGHQQLFTENTLTAVLPVVARRKLQWVWQLLRLWATVLIANLVGCFLFALFLQYGGAVSDEVHANLIKVAEHLAHNSMWAMFAKGIVAGWLIAALVWILPSVEGNEFWVIILITYLIALGELTHVIAGSAEMFFLYFNGGTTLYHTVFVFFGPTLLGNLFGGTVLFSVLSYIQVREEIV